MPVPQQQFADVNGNPYALGSLTFYAAGTTNPQDTFFDSDLAPGHENSNPLTLDAAGRALAYLSPLGYRVILKDANGVTIYDQDDIFGTDISILLGNQTANRVFAGPSSGSPAPATFRALVAADLPSGIGTWTVVTTTSTGSQNDFAPGIVGNTIVRCNNATDLTLTGLDATGLTSGTQILLVPVGAGNLITAHQNTGSSAANRFINIATSANTTATPIAGSMWYELDGATTRWRLIGHVQGAAIDYTATSTVTGWASFTSGRKFVKYVLVGRQLQVQWHLEGTSNSTSSQFTIPFTTDGSGSFPSYYAALGFAYDNGVAATTTGVAVISPAANLIQTWLNQSNAGWTNSGTKISSGQLSVTVA